MTIKVTITPDIPNNHTAILVYHTYNNGVEDNITPLAKVSKGESVDVYCWAGQNILIKEETA